MLEKREESDIAQSRVAKSSRELNASQQSGDFIIVENQVTDKARREQKNLVNYGVARKQVAEQVTWKQKGRNT